MSNPRYVLRRPLGNGGFGCVTEAWDRVTCRLVAVKHLRGLSPADRERFAREARMYQREEGNPFVLSLLDYDLNAQPPYLVLEHCPFGSLRSWVGQSRPWQEVAIALKHALLGLRTIHAKGGFHRDIKPDNLLVGIDPTSGLQVVKVGDFGLARVPFPHSHSPITCGPAGTPGYIAPEVLAGRPFSAQADLYSLGVTGIELLTGTKDPRRLGRGCPDALRHVLRRLTLPEPRERPGLEEVVQILSRLLEADEQVGQAAQEEEALRTSTDTPTGVGAVLLGGLVVAAGALAIGALAGGIAELWKGDEKHPEKA